MLSNLAQKRFFKIFANAIVLGMLFVTVFAPIAMVGQTPTLAVAHAQGKASLACSITDSKTYSLCLSDIVYVFAVTLPFNFALITSGLFNFGVQLGLNSASYALDFLSQGWAIVRDIANLAFIFILIYIAYTVIIEAETTGTMRALAAVIVMALLINFSFFLTRVAIDAGNILSVQFYNALPITASVESPLATKPGGPKVFVKDLTSGIMDATKTQTLLSSDAFKQFYSSNDFGTNFGSLTIVYVAMGILLALLGFIFLVVGVKFIVRVVILWLVIIASPLAFAAHALPGNKKINGYYKLWLSHLIQSSFYPAVFLFLFYITTLFMNGIGGPNGLLPSVFQGSNGITGIIVNTAIRVGLVVVLLFYAMKFSDKFSEEGSHAANSVTSWLGNRGAGVAGWTARNTAGRAANAAAQSSLIKNWAASSVTGRPVMAALKGVAGSSLDVRGVSGLKSLAGTAGMRLNNAPKTSFEKQVKNRIENVKARAKELKGDEVEIAKEQSKYESFRKAHEGGETGFNARKAEIERNKRHYEAESHNAGYTKNIQADFKKRAEEEDKKLFGYLDGKARVKRLEDERLNKFASRLGDRVPANLGFIPGPLTGPSRGSIVGSAKVYARDLEPPKDHGGGHGNDGGGGGDAHPPTPAAHHFNRTKNAVGGMSDDKYFMDEVRKEFKTLKNTLEDQGASLEKIRKDPKYAGGAVDFGGRQRPQRTSDEVRQSISERKQLQQNPIDPKNKLE
jgi:hypothetical protein